MTRPKTFNPAYISVGMCAVALAYMMYWRWQVGMHRFFDVDEFSYLHWVASFTRGERPYVDFFMFFTPGFLWVFAPIVAFFQYSETVFIAARVFSFVIFSGILSLVILLFGKTRGWIWSLLPAVVLAFLPMPYDKFMEIRPDNLATLFALGGLVAEVIALQTLRSQNKTPDANEYIAAVSGFPRGKSRSIMQSTNPLAKRIHAIFYMHPPDLVWFISALLYSASLLVFAKTIPIVIVGIVIAFFAFWYGRGVRISFRAFNVKRLLSDGPLKSFLLGFVVPFVLFFLWTLTLGDFSTVWYSLTKLPFEANMMGNLTVMEPHLFFFPNGSFYGGEAVVNLPLVSNNLIWFIAILTGVYRLCTAWSTADGERTRVLTEFLISGAFIFSVLGYVRFFPLKHSQYLIPIACFIAYYFSDFAVRVFAYIRKYTGYPGVITVAVFFLYTIGIATVRTNTVKLSWNNELQLSQTRELIRNIAKTSSVLDLEGRLLFWHNDYEICCVPFGSFVPFLSRKPSVLRETLESKKTPYIFQGDSNRLSLLTADDQSYIRTAYTPVAGWGEGLWIRKQ